MPPATSLRAISPVREEDEQVDEADDAVVIEVLGASRARAPRGEHRQQVLEVHRESPIYAIYFMQSGGAVNRKASTDTAFPHRSAHSNMMLWNQWHDLESEAEREARIAEVRSDWARLERFTHGYYVNLNEEDAARTHANYGENYERLVKVKNKYDPTNLMHMNANIEPTA